MVPRQVVAVAIGGRAAARKAKSSCSSGSSSCSSVLVVVVVEVVPVVVFVTAASTVRKKITVTVKALVELKANNRNHNAAMVSVRVGVRVVTAILKAVRLIVVMEVGLCTVKLYT